MIQLALKSENPEQTLSIGRWLGENSWSGLMIALNGDLGTGKTVLVRGIGESIGVTDVINSPTYVLVKSYAGKIMLHHSDWYRLNHADDVETSGFTDLYDNKSLLIVEWAEKFPEMLDEPHLQINIKWESDQERTLEFNLVGNSSEIESMLENLSSFSEENSDWRLSEQHSDKTSTI